MQAQQEHQHWVLRKTEFLDLPIVKEWSGGVGEWGSGDFFLKKEGRPVWVFYAQNQGRNTCDQSPEEWFCLAVFDLSNEAFSLLEVQYISEK